MAPPDTGSWDFGHRYPRVVGSTSYDTTYIRFVNEFFCLQGTIVKQLSIVSSIKNYPGYRGLTVSVILNYPRPRESAFPKFGG